MWTHLTSCVTRQMIQLQTLLMNAALWNFFCERLYRYCNPPAQLLYADGLFAQFFLYWTEKYLLKIWSLKFLSFIQWSTHQSVYILQILFKNVCDHFKLLPSYNIFVYKCKCSNINGYAELQLDSKSFQIMRWKCSATKQGRRLGVLGGWQMPTPRNFLPPQGSLGGGKINW